MNDWRDDIFQVLQDHDIKQVYHVPDAGHSKLIEACQTSNSIRTVALTTEEEGIPLAAGAWLGGQRSVLLMQSSGVGNTINLLGLTKTLRVNDAGLTHGLMRLHHEERPPTDEWVNQALIVERRV